jgi:hypothetical protein
VKPRRAAIILFAAAAVAAVLLAALAAVDVKPAAAGWLVGFVFWCGPPIGSLVWMMIHRLTGGRWGDALGPVFTANAAMIPALAIMLIPIIAAMSVLYNWMSGGGKVLPSVAQLYLDGPLFIIRSVIAFAGWTILAFAVPRMPGRRGMLLSAFGLVFYGVLISLVPVDWILSLEHPFVSESFGASVAITHLIAALAWAALLAPRGTEDVDADLGALLLAMVLAITYVDFMALLVIWYGDLPDKVFWFVERNQSPWLELAIIAFVLGSALPILSLLLARVRRNRFALRVVSTMVLLGLAVYDAYLIVPPFGWVALVAAALALIAIGALLAGLLCAGLPTTVFEQRSAPDVR